MSTPVIREARTTYTPPPTRGAAPVDDAEDSAMPVAVATADAATATPESQADAVMRQLKEAGLPIPDSDDPLGTCTTSNGDKIRLKELDGEDETFCEAFMDHYGVRAEGAGRATSLRFMALMSIDTINGEQRARVDRIEFLQILLRRYKRTDQARIVAAYIRFNLAADGSPFRP